MRKINLMPHLSSNPTGDNVLSRFLKGTALDIIFQLIGYASITPEDKGCLEHLAKALEAMGWEAHVIVFNETKNLYARFGTGNPHLCFAGHVDVVPAGDEKLWICPPFQGIKQDGWLYGRGTADMKGAIGCFFVAVRNFLSTIDKDFQGSVSILLTSDEEGAGLDGTRRMIPWLEENKQIPDVVLIGEPTGSEIGEVLQVGRRGSMVAVLEVHGVQGHIACPELADNPIPRLLSCLGQLTHMPLDTQEDPVFQPSRLEVTSIDTGNDVENMIPERSTGRFGIRFNTQQTAEKLEKQVRNICETYGGKYSLKIRHSGDPFVTQNEDWIGKGIEAIKSVTNQSPKLSTKGGTTDGRFLCALAPVIEIGFPETTIHQVNERIRLDDIPKLTQIYTHLLQLVFPPL